MAQVNNAILLRPSILDRLIDDAPGAEQGPLHGHFQDIRRLKSVVARDLEAMLNTRQEALEELPAGFDEVSDSLLTYGLPDYTSLNLLSVQDRQYMRRALEQAVKRFEPRLKHVRVTLEPPRQYERQLRFRVEAVLPLRPVPEPVVFDAVLRLHTQDFLVRGQN